MLFVADSTVEFLERRPEELVFVDEFEIRGRKGTIQLWSLAVAAEPGEPPALAATEAE